MPQDSSEDESTFSHEEANVNHKVDNKMGRKKTRRGGRRRNWYNNFSSDEYYQDHYKRSFVKSCLKGITPKPSSIHDNNLLRKDENGTGKVTIANHSIIHAKAIWVPKHQLTNMRGPNGGWVPSKVE